MRREKIIKNILFWFFILLITALLLFNQYMIMVSQGKADKIEALREMVDKKNEIITLQDTIIYHLKDSINELNNNEEQINDNNRGKSDRR